MVVVLNVEVDKVKEVLNGTKSKANVSLEYSPRDCAVSADSETMQSLKPRLLKLKASHRDMEMLDLDVSVAYHSCHVDTAAAQLIQLIQGVSSKAPSVTFISTVTGKAVEGDLQVRHWADNMKKPVLFHQAVIYSVSSKASSNTVFLEIGPKPVLRAHMKDLFPDGQHKTVASLTKSTETKSLLQAVCALYECGAEIHWKRLHAQRNRLTDVPRYSFDKKRLKEKTEPALVRCGGYNIYKKNHLCVYPTEESPTSFRLLLSPLTIPSVYHHVVMGKIVIPGALYAECGFAVAKFCPTTSPTSVSVEFQQLLSMKKDDIIDVEILPQEPDSKLDLMERRFVIQKNDKRLATIRLTAGDSKPNERVNLELLRSQCTEEFNKSSIYALLRAFGFEFKSAFSQLEYAHRNSTECLATPDYPEVLVTEEAVYVNQVVEVRSSLSVPRRRATPAASMKNIKGNVVLLSEESAKFRKLRIVNQTYLPSSEHQTTLRAYTFAQPPEKLFNTRISSLHLLPDRKESSSDYVVMALEVTGNIAGGEGQELTSCCPLAVGPEVTVSMDTTIETASIPQYQAGDLSKLVLFWSLIDRVPTSQFTILASRSTLHLAQLLKLLSCNASQRGDSDVNIVMIEDLMEDVSYKQTILSLVLVDVNTMSMIAKHWRDPHSLVSCCCLVTSDVTAFMACVWNSSHRTTQDTSPSSTDVNRLPNTCPT